MKSMTKIEQLAGKSSMKKKSNSISSNAMSAWAISIIGTE